MKKIFTKILAMITLVLMPLSRYIHKRDILVFFLGALAMLVSMRAVCARDIAVESPVEPTPVVTEAVIVPRTPTTNPEAANIARVLYGVREYHLSENAKLAIIETIFARVECTYGEFGDTVSEVCLKPQQWQGFSENSAYMKEDYELALDYINGDHTARITPEGCYWFVVSDKGVTVRTDFNGGNAWTVE